MLIEPEFNLESSSRSKNLTASFCGFLAQQEKYIVSGFQVSQRTEIKLCSLESDKVKGSENLSFSEWLKELDICSLNLWELSCKNWNRETFMDQEMWVPINYKACGAWWLKSSILASPELIWNL